MARIRLATFALALSLLLGPVPGVARAAGGWRWPVDGPIITPYRNGDDRFAGGQHRGIDIAAAVGTPVVAASGGTVSFAGVAGSSGLTVAVRVGDGLETTYLHLSSSAVRAGQRVDAGARIGAVGVSGHRSATEPHLHFGVRQAADRFAYRDPLDFLPPPVRAPGPAPRPVPVVVPRPAPIGPALLPLARVPVVPGLSAHGAPRRPAPRSLLGDVAHPAPAASAPTPGLGPRTVGTSTRIGAPAAAGSALAHVARGVHLGAAAAPGAARHGHDVHDPARDRAASHAPSGGPGRAPASGPGAASEHGRRPASPRAHARRAAPDLGWLAACIGLVAAAALLGRPAGPAETIRRTRRRAVAWLRPVSGRG